MKAKWKPGVTQLRPDWFLIGMGFAVMLAYLFPNPGADGGSLHPEILTKAGIALIFFLNGLSISFDAMRAGILRWQVHLIVQACTFLLFPLLGFAFNATLGNWMSPELRLGFFYLCALPSTVSSSVAMTAAAKGNVPIAVFNASLSSLLGVVLTPLWIGFVMQSDKHHSSINMIEVIVELLEWLILPLIIGQIARRWLAGWAAKNKRFTQTADRCTILLLVYTSFCDSMKRGVWSQNSFETLFVTVLATGLLFAVVLLSTTTICRLAKITEGEQIATVFCGSKKSLASGVPMATLIFGADPRISLILLPIMLYHPLQLVICSALASKWAKAKETRDAQSTTLDDRVIETE